MCDLIKKEDVLKIIDNEIKNTSDYLQHNTQINIRFKVEELPTVEAKLVIRGEWKVKTKSNNGCGYTVSITCSACGYSHSRVMYNFCPECGADMRKGGVNNV